MVQMSSTKRATKWHGSVYKLLWQSALVYGFLYAMCTVVYKFCLTESEKRTYEKLAHYCDHFRNLIPLSFILGFYVSKVVHRWYKKYFSIPWPDDFAIFCAGYINGEGGVPRHLRQTLLRYANLGCVMTFRQVSGRIKKKFQSYKAMMNAGYLTLGEMRILETQAEKAQVPVMLVPYMWCTLLIQGARSQGYVREDWAMKTLIDEIASLKDKSELLLRWTTISIPLLYTQVATISVFSFFLLSVLGRQFWDPDTQSTILTIEFFVPIFLLLQFFVYMGWLKAAEVLINPFGDDDDDFDLDRIMQRHLEMSYLLGNVTAVEVPNMVRESTNLALLPIKDSDDNNHRRFSEPTVPTFHVRLKQKFKKNHNNSPLKPSTYETYPTEPAFLLTNALRVMKLSVTDSALSTLPEMQASETRNIPLPESSALRVMKLSVTDSALSTLPERQASETKNIPLPESSDPIEEIDGKISARIPSPDWVSSREDPVGFFLWDERIIPHTMDDPIAGEDTTPILSAKPSFLDLCTPPISTATTPTEDFNIISKFTEAQQDLGPNKAEVITVPEQIDLHVLKGQGLEENECQGQDQGLEKNEGQGQGQAHEQGQGQENNQGQGQEKNECQGLSQGLGQGQDQGPGQEENQCHTLPKDFMEGYVNPSFYIDNNRQSLVSSI